MIEKEIVYNRIEQPDLDLMVVKNIGKNSVRDLCGGLHTENNNNLLGNEHNPPNSHQEDFTIFKKQDRRFYYFVQITSEIF